MAKSKTFVVYKTQHRETLLKANRLSRKKQLSFADSLHSKKSNAQNRAKSLGAFWSELIGRK